MGWAGLDRVRGRVVGVGGGEVGGLVFSVMLS
jgi:hypothetical protein